MKLVKRECVAAGLRREPSAQAQAEGSVERSSLRSILEEEGGRKTAGLTYSKMGEPSKDIPEEATR